MSGENLLKCISIESASREWALYHLTNATFNQRGTKRYFEEEICKSVGRKILEINSRKCKYIFFTRRWVESYGLFPSFEIRNFPVSSSLFVEQKHIGDEFFLPSIRFPPFLFLFFFPLPFSVPCSSLQDAQKPKSSFSEKSLSRVSLLPTGIIFPRNDKSIVERSFGLEIDLDSILDFFSAH